MLKHNQTSDNTLNPQIKDINQFSYYLNPITNKYPSRRVTLREVFDLIVRGEYLETTNKLRSTEDLKERKVFKSSNLPYVTFSGEFTERADSKLIFPSNLFAIDLDHIDVNRLEIKQRLIEDKKLQPLLIFTSPSGDGLKVVIGIDYNEIAEHDNERVTDKIWRAVNAYFCKAYSDLIMPNDKDEIIDGACKDLSRACFLCHDADAYLKEGKYCLHGQEFLNEMLPQISKVVVTHKKRDPVKIKRVNPNTTLKELDERHLQKEDNHHTHLLAFIGAAKNLSFPQEQVVNYIKTFVHIAPDSSHREGGGVVELVEDVYQRYSTDSEGIKYLSSRSFGYMLFRFTYSTATKCYELTSMLWAEVLNELHRAGFAKRRFGGDYRYIKVNGCIISECSPEDMRDYMTGYIQSITDGLSFSYQGEDCQIPAAALREVYFKNSNNFFNPKWLEHLQIHDKPILKDTALKMFFFFQNCLITISKEEGLKTQDWTDIDDYCIWDKQIINRDYTHAPDFTKAHFYTFIKNVTANDDKRYETMQTAIGYLLHHYFNESEGQAVIFIDQTITDIKKPMGGSGKGLIVNALKQLRNVAKVDGKHFSALNRFCWEVVTPSTQIVWLDDAKPDFDFAVLHSNLTDGWTVEKKYVPQMVIGAIDSPKTVLTSNSIITGDGTTNVRRQFTVELSDFYSKQIVNGDEKPIEATHGCIFFSFTAWSIEEWNMFSSFMFDCALQYLTTGLVNYVGVNIEINRFRQSTDEDFAEWAEEQGFKKNIEYTTADLHANYIDLFYGGNSITIGQKKFTGNIKAYAAFKKWKFNRVQKNGVTYFYFT